MSQDSFENVPNWFDRIEVRRVGRVKKERNVVVEEPLFGLFALWAGAPSCKNIM